MTITAHLQIDQGSTFTDRLQYLDGNNDPVNLTGYYLRGFLRETYSSQNAFALNLDYDNITTGNIVVSLTSQETAYLEKTRYVYDIEGYNQGNVIRLFEGIATVNPGVTSVAQPSFVVNRDTLTVGNIIPKANLIYSIGTPTDRFSNLYLTYSSLISEPSNTILDGSLLVQGTLYSYSAQTASYIDVSTLTARIDDLIELARGPQGETGNTGPQGPEGAPGGFRFTMQFSSTNANVSFIVTSSDGFTDGEENPVLYLLRGTEFIIINQAHEDYPVSVLDEKNGNVLYGPDEFGITRINVPYNSPNVLYYHANAEPEMGNFIIVR